MSTEINNNLYVAAPKALDSRWGVFEAGVWRPFSSVSEALTKVEDGLRHKTMVLAVTTPAGIVDYWFRDGVENVHFIRKDYDKIRNELVVDGVSIGDAVNGTTYPEGTTQEEILRAILQKTTNPTITAPSFSVASSLPYLIKIGQNLTLQISANFNRGLIFQPWDSQMQNFRAGLATSYSFTGDYGLNITGVSSVISHAIAVIQGIATFNASVQYALGPQPLNSKEQNYLTPLAAGSIGASFTLEGVHPILATVASITGQNELALYSMITGNNIEATLAAESGGNKQTFWIPKVWHTVRPVTKIEYFNSGANSFDTVNRLSQWSVLEENIGGILYIRYRYSGSDRGQLKIKIIF